VYDMAARSHKVVAKIDQRRDGPLFAWSPDGRYLACAVDGMLSLVDTTGASAARSLARGSGPRFESDGAMLLAQCAAEPPDVGQSYCRIDLSTGSVEMLPGSPMFLMTVSVPHLMALDHREDKLEVGIVDLSSAERRLVVRASPPSGPWVKRLPSEPPWSASWDIHARPGWSADQSRILYASGADIRAIAPDGTQDEIVLNGVPDVHLSTVTISPDGKRVFFAADVPGADAATSMAMTGELPADLYVADTGTGRARRCANRHACKLRFRLSPNGRYIVYEHLRRHEVADSFFWSELWMMKT